MKFGRDQETISQCIMDLAGPLKMDAIASETIRRMQASRMGIYEVIGKEGNRCRMRELVTEDEFVCHVASGYQGSRGELWYVRLGPPLNEWFDYHVVITTPYVLLGATKVDWVAYLKKSILGSSDMRKALHQFLKYGKASVSRKADESWNEFIFQAYHHHKTEVIFLSGIPDVKGSLPHA